jgi:methionyl-tRNA formyltransferase
MLNKDRGRIDWQQSARNIHNQVRGLSPWPGAYTIIQGEVLKLGATSPEDGTDEVPGTVLEAGPEGVRIACGEGVLRVRELQLPGKKRLAAAEFLRGRPLPAGTRLES